MKLNVWVFMLVLFLLTRTAISAQTTTINFNQDKSGEAPSGFSTALTGRGRPGKWVIMKDPASPNQSNILAQTDADPTGYRFPLCVYDGLTAKDVDVSVKFKPVSGKGDQGAGIVWRYRDKDNYYIVRANALEGNVVLYKVENGKRTDLPLVGKGRTYGMKEKVPSSQWSTLRVAAKGDLFEVYYNGNKLYEVKDETFKDAGKVGLWTKADSVIYFDDLQITVL
ncbi:MAG TPA: family 16 glycoside hydrolase [Pyrinomonadaceae bacterium]|nr:family 16 glycoside hydrolase [Pyrinomonadaceae bacterium]